MITIIDYGLGNIRAFFTVYEHLKVKVKIASVPDDLKDATKLILQIGRASCRASV